MRAFYVAWRDEGKKLKQVAGEINSAAILQQPAGELSLPKPPQVTSDIPWFHNVVLIQKLKDPAQRLWYAQQTVVNGWSRSMLVHWIESDLYARHLCYPGISASTSFASSASDSCQPR